MSKILKIISGFLEILLGIPIIGIAIVWGTFLVMPIGLLILHIVTLVFSVKEETKKHGSILGIVAFIIGFIPFIGWVLRIVTGIFLLIDGFSKKDQSSGDVNGEIIKLKNMLDSGMITEVEFEQKRKQLLGLL